MMREDEIIRTIGAYLHQFKAKELNNISRLKKLAALARWYMERDDFALWREKVIGIIYAIETFDGEWNSDYDPFLDDHKKKIEDEDLL